MEDGLLPKGYESIEGRHGDLLVRSDWRDTLVAAGVLDGVPLEDAGDEIARVGGGRRPLSCRELPSRGALDSRVVLAKRIVRGGILGALLGSGGGADRALKEIAVTEFAGSRGVRVAPIVAATSRRIGTGGRFETALLVACLDGARDLREVLGDATSAEVAGVARAAGQAVARLHHAGVAHEDLNLKNLLSTEDGTVAIIDLGQSAFSADPVPPGTAAKNLARLYRSVVKNDVDGALGRLGAARFLRAYAPDRWREVWSDVHRRLRIALPLHRISWWMQGKRP